LVSSNSGGTELAEFNEVGQKKGGNVMASEILVSQTVQNVSGNADRLSLNLSIEQIAQLARWFAYAVAVFIPFLSLAAFALR
jgi:hypothetical protein